jgi:hypothetical protein
MRCAAGKRVTIAVPTWDINKGAAVLGPEQEWLFKNEQKWEKFLDRKELSGVMEVVPATGQEVVEFDQLVDGGVYTGVPRPSAGALGTLQGADRSRINAAEQEFGQALRQLVAVEEGVDVANVELVSASVFS